MIRKIIWGITFSLFWSEHLLPRHRPLSHSGLFRPDQIRAPGYISNYQFYVSEDNSDWKLVDEGEFPNINNNPMWQIKNFTPVKARYIKLRALKNTNGKG